MKNEEKIQIVDNLLILLKGKIKDKVQKTNKKTNC